ncbi:unnamed protein product [Orchesella dallaii]|uniref:Uncharacterized protein n=1 Tax=Orchesella dallaii TaxID=48710 RepID=A0ABP1PSM9_9HEXA
MKSVAGAAKNLENEIIRVAVVEEEGIADLTMVPSDSTIQYNATHYVTGIAIDILQFLRIKLNFPPPVITIVDSFLPNSTSNAVSTASWNVTASELLETNKTDLVGGYLYLLPARSKIANAMWPLSTERFEVYFRQPSFTPFDYNPFTKQFSRDLAVAILFLMTISAVLLASVRILPQWDHLLNKRVEFWWRNLLFDYLRQFYDTFFWAVGAWCQQGKNKN